ncbi:MAG: 4-hydroxythreonine-4-phosphate dehydrogenase PdxA [Candidatus Gastranaerophilales bacterium]|nr:4-hydroxythreonine-4-phosphate dehydrogenase PdxA [Candidatus Gastranaerophilales bacterium]
MKNYKIAITTGDKKGIGKEITKKALDFLMPDKKEVVIIGEKIDVDYDFIEIHEENNGKFCYKSLETACLLAKEGKIKGLTTSPVSKAQLYNAGYCFNGQTEVIEKLLAHDNQKAQMIFIAEDLKVMLLTRHCALKDIKLDINEIIEQTKILNNFLIEKYNLEDPKIALCALNPHCGEEGILGREEIDILKPAVKKLNELKINITNPISADALFARIGKEYINKEKLSYDAILSCYHDQGLCPIKALAFDKAINTTIGLDIIRTSPSSGTAYDIAGKNIANPDSMIEAIKLALKLSN